MSTKRKTLKQKRMSDLRRANPTPDMNTSTIAQTTPTYSFVTSQTKPQSSLSSQQMTMFSYNLADIKYSVIISSLLLLANGIIYILIQNGIIPLKMFGL